MSNIYKIQYATFSEKRWANTLDLILKDSVQRGLDIKYIKSLDLKDESINIVKSKKTLGIQGTGNYYDIVKFINYITTLDSLLDIKSSVIELEKTSLKFTLEIDIYGVGL